MTHKNEQITRNASLYPSGFGSSGLLRIKVSFIDITYDIIDIHYIEEFLIFVMPLLFLYYSSSGSKNARPHRTDAILKLRVAPES